MLKVDFNGTESTIQASLYYNLNTCIVMLEVATNQPFAIATVNFDTILPYNMAYIKNYAENEGMLDALKRLGVIEEICYWRNTGYIKTPLCRLNKGVLELGQLPNDYIRDKMRKNMGLPTLGYVECNKDKSPGWYEANTIDQLGDE